MCPAVSASSEHEWAHAGLVNRTAVVRSRMRAPIEMPVPPASITNPSGAACVDGRSRHCAGCGGVGWYFRDLNSAGRRCMRLLLADYHPVGFVQLNLQWHRKRVDRAEVAMCLCVAPVCVYSGSGAGPEGTAAALPLFGIIKEDCADFVTRPPCLASASLLVAFDVDLSLLFHVVERASDRLVALDALGRLRVLGGCHATSGTHRMQSKFKRAQMTNWHNNFPFTLKAS